MKATTIILATDFSVPSQAALEWASALAKNGGAKLLVVHVEPGQPTAGMGGAYLGIPDPGISELARDLVAVMPTEPGVECEHRIYAGDPATEIVRLAEEEHADAVVVGSHGRTGARRILMGSVAEAVLRKAPCPVLVCKQPVPQRPAEGDVVDQSAVNQNISRGKP